MTKAAIVILAGTESHENLGYLVNGLEAAAEFQEHDDDLKVIFDGAGTQWIPDLAGGDHDASPLYEALSEHVFVCDHCAGAFGVTEAVESSDAEALAEYDGHPSIRQLVADGYEVITF